MYLIIKIYLCEKYNDYELERKSSQNQSFKERIGIEEKNYSIVSRIIRETVNAGLIKGYALENIIKKAVSYIPYVTEM